MTYANKPHLNEFVEEFSECYGLMCQIFDDMREIKDDVENKYWSLPVSFANQQSLNLDSINDLNRSIERSSEIAKTYFERAKNLCQTYGFNGLYDLVERIGKSGLAIKY